MQHQDYNLLNDITKYIEERYREERMGVITQEVADKFNISLSISHRYISTLIKNGSLIKGKRGYEPTNLSLASQRTKHVPFYGNAIPCGPLSEIEGYIDEVFLLPESITGKGDFFLLKTHGDSMIDAGICSGDIVLVRQQSSAEVGEIVVALVDGESTLKRLKKNGSKFFLHPENNDLEDIYVENLEIQGVVTKVIKDIS